MRELFLRFGISLDDRAVDCLENYYHMLVEWNERINLTAITDHEEVVRKHFLDSAMLIGKSDSLTMHLVSDQTLIDSQGLDEQDQNSFDRFQDFVGRDDLSLLDVGTGAGFPGLVLAILRPTWKVVLLEPIQKRVDFLNEVVKELSLDSVCVVRGRSETLGHDPEHRGVYDLVVSRAVAELRVLSELCLPFVSPDGYFVSYKGPQFEEELVSAGHAFEELHCHCCMSLAYTLDDAQRSLVVIEHTGEMPDRYPRRDGIPAKRPL